MIETLKAQLHLALHRQFGRRNESVDVDRIGLFAGDLDESTVIELSVAAAEEAADTKDDRALVAPGAAPAVRKKAVRILKDLPRQIKVIDIPESGKICSCCGCALHHFGDESSEHLGYFPATVKIIETRRKKYACDACHGEVKRAAFPQTEPLAKRCRFAGASRIPGRIWAIGPLRYQLPRDTRAAVRCWGHPHLTATSQVDAVVLDIGEDGAMDLINWVDARLDGRTLEIRDAEAIEHTTSGNDPKSSTCVARRQDYF